MLNFENSKTLEKCESLSLYSLQILYRQDYKKKGIQITKFK